MARRLTKGEFNQRCIDNHNDDFIFDNTIIYTKMSDQVTATCKTCGWRTTRRGETFTNCTAKCPICSNCGG